MLSKKKPIIIIMFSIILLLIVIVVAMKYLFIQTKPQKIEESSIIQNITTDKASYRQN
jgi:dextranase